MKEDMQFSKLLIVDDNAVIRDMLAFALKDEDYQLFSAADGASALQIMDEHSPSLVILDVMMPNMNGFEVCKKIRSNPKFASTYIMMLSAKVKTQDRVTGLNSGADTYLTKPFDVDELLAMIRVGLKTERERSKAFHDKLTGLYNRHFFEQVMEKELALFHRRDVECALILMDLDYFKKVNDKHGHDVGDKVLKNVAILLKEAARDSDLVFRWGGEEFAWLLPMTDYQEAKTVAERFRKKIEEKPIIDNLSLTASFGVTITEKGDKKDTFYKKADKALYQSKSQGRNKVS